MPTRLAAITNLPWIDYGVSPDEDVGCIQHGYDRNSNRLWRQNDVARAQPSGGKKFAQQYTYDDLNRLTFSKHGLLDGNHTIPASGDDLTFRQQWGLDPVGNWDTFNQDDDGGASPDWELEQSRAHNKVNEITGITETTGPAWATPAYDPAGNTTSIPKPSDLTASYDATYDAWNRLVKVEDGEDTVAEYEYAGNTWMTGRKGYDAGMLDETRHYYYSNGWQVIEERLGTSPDSADAERQFVWGLRYIDDLVRRDRDTSEPPNGELNERLYCLQDPNFNVAAITDASGDPQERDEYDAYGVCTVLTPSFGTRASSSFDWQTRYAGYRDDELLALYHVRNRQYNTQLGRWLQQDPEGYVDGLNRYEYTRGMPVKYVDPRGTQSGLPPLPPSGPAKWIVDQKFWVDHYYNGSGAPIDLAMHPGLATRFRNAPDVRAKVAEFEQWIRSNASGEITAALSLGILNCEGNRSTTYGLLNHSATDVTSEIFAIGRSTFFRTATCTVSIDACACCVLSKILYPVSVSYSCDPKYAIRDWFRDPLDIGREVGGTPYRINYTWMGSSIKGRAEFECLYGTFPVLKRMVDE